MGSVCYASVTSNYLTSSVDKPHKSFLKRDKNHDSVKAVRERERAVGRIGRSIMSQFILCNYFKVCTTFTLERAE